MLKDRGRISDYLDHPPILISDSDEFSDITQLLHNGEDDSPDSSDRDNSYKVNLCHREVTISYVIQ